MNCTVAEFGARGDGLSLTTAAIQNAIDRCHASGGGVVRVPAGCFRIGTLELRSGVMLELAAGAVLLASEDPADYRKAFPGQDSLVTGIFDSPFNRDQRLIFAKGAKRCGICGHGVIDANGGSPSTPTPPSGRPDLSATSASSAWRSVPCTGTISPARRRTRYRR